MPEAQGVSLRSQDPAPPLPSWLSVSGWVALLALLLSSVLPRLEAPLNIAGALGLLALPGILLYRRAPLLPTRGLRLALWAFLISSLLSAFVPRLPHWPDWSLLFANASELWNLIRAVTAGGLVLALTPRRSDRFALVALFSLVISMIALGVPLERWLSDAIDTRISGTKGGANRYAILMFASVFMLLLLHAYRSPQIRLPRWGLVAGYALVLLTPWLLLRKKFEVWEQQPLLLCGSHTLALAVLIGGMLLGGLIFLRVVNEGRTRRYAAMAGMGLLTVNALISQSRLVLASFVLLAGLLVLARVRQRVIVLAATGLLGVVFLTAAVINGRCSTDQVFEDWDIRSAIREEAWTLFTRHPILGVGYGRDAFRDHWTFPSPSPLPELGHGDIAFSHAHNLWMQLLATQGILGWLTFHALWLGVVLYLFRCLRQTPHPLRPCPEERNLATTAPPSQALEASGDLMRAGREGITTCLLAMLLLQINGILEFPLQDCNEMLFWVLGALGVSLASAESADAPTCD